MDTHGQEWEDASGGHWVSPTEVGSTFTDCKIAQLLTAQLLSAQLSSMYLTPASYGDSSFPKDLLECHGPRFPEAFKK